MAAVLGKVGKGHYVPRLIITACLVCYPYFNPGDIQAGTYCRQAFQGIVVNIPEMLCKKEVTVCLIVVSIYLKLAQLGSSLDRNG